MPPRAGSQELSSVNRGAAPRVFHPAAPSSKPGLASTCAVAQLPGVYMSQPKWTTSTAPVESFTVRVTVESPSVVGVPVIRPVPGSRVRPAGRPVAV